MLLLFSSEGSVFHEKSSRVPFTGVAAPCNTGDGDLAKLLELEKSTVAVVVMLVHAATLT